MAESSLPSVIISTYNSPSFLALVLRAMSVQTSVPHEIIVADDGSSQDVRPLIERFKESVKCPIRYSWLPDNDFRLARSRNIASHKATGEWLIFLDGDCVVEPSFIERFLTFADADRILFTNRKLMDRETTEFLLGSGELTLKVEQYQTGRKFWKLPLGIFRKIPKRSWKNARGFMLAMRRDSFGLMGGFDEAYIGWGLEDSDLAVRGQRFGLQLYDARYGIGILHLYHPEPDQKRVSTNCERFQKMLKEPHRVSPNRSIFSEVDEINES